MPVHLLRLRYEPGPPSHLAVALTNGHPHHWDLPVGFKFGTEQPTFKLQIPYTLHVSVSTWYA